MANSKRDIAPLVARAAFQPSSVNAEKRTAEVVFSEGARVLRNSYFDGASYEELSMDPAHIRMGRLNNGAPFLADHRGETSSVMGVVESARIENGKGIAIVRFPTAGISEKADQMFALVRDGILQNISVGYRTYKAEQTNAVEARGGAIPIFRATDWEPFEISAVAIGADDAAGFRSADQTTLNQCVFSTRERNMDPEEMKRLADLKAADEAKTRSTELETVRTLASKAERERASGITAAVRAAKLGDDVASKMISEGTSLDAARAFVLESLAKRTDSTEIESHHSPVTGGETHPEKAKRGMIASLLSRTGQSASMLDAQRKGDARFKDLDLDGGEYRRMSMTDMQRELLELSGVNTRRMGNDQIVDAVFAVRAGANGLVPASDFAVLYENVMGKVLLGAYATAPDSWRAFCKTDTVRDFRTSPRYRVGSFGTLDNVTEGDEYKNKSIPDGQKYTIKTATRGNIIGLTRQAIINDDMSANADLASRFGRSAGLSIESDVYAFLASNSGLGGVLSDGLTLFHASHGNIGSSAPISVASLDADRILMAQQKDQSSNEVLDLRPRVLLVPVTLGSTARRLNLAEFDNDGTAMMKPNVVRGLFGTVVESARLTGTRRYLFADPSLAPAITVVFLEGTGESPYMEQFQEFRRDGINWKIRLDMLVQGAEFKGSLSNAGV